MLEVIIIIIAVVLVFTLGKKLLSGTMGFLSLLGAAVKKCLYILFLGLPLLASTILHSVTKFLHLQWLAYPVLCVLNPLSLIYALFVNIPYSKREKDTKELFAEKKRERLIVLAMPPFIVALGIFFLFLCAACEDEIAVFFLFLIACAYLIVAVVFTVYKIHQWKKNNAEFYDNPQLLQKSYKHKSEIATNHILIEKKKQYRPTISEWKDGVSEKGLQKKTTKKVTIPNGLVAQVDSDSFRDFKKLESVTLLDGIERIGAGAFFGCENLSSITIAESVKEIGNNAFTGCSHLAEIVFGGTMAQWEDVSGKQNLIFEVPAAVIKCADGEVKRPDLITSRGVVECCDKSVTEITIPEGVTKIRAGAFRNCKALSSVTLPDGLTEIENEAFLGCASLSSVAIPETLLRIGRNAFTGCAGNLVISFTGSERLWNVIRKSAFWNSGISVKMRFAKTERSLQNPFVIENACLKHCDELAQTVKVPETVNEIVSGAFSGCRFLISVTLHDAIQKIDDGAFSHSHISKIIYEGTKEQWEKIAGEVRYVPEVIFVPYRNARQKQFCTMLGEL